MFELGLCESTGVEPLFATAEQAADMPWGTAASTFDISGRFRDALTVDDVEGWLDCSLLQHPFFKMFLDGQQVPARLVASPRSVAGQVVTGMIDGAKARSVFAQGATLMLCNMHEWHAPSRELCRALTDALVAEVKATAFYSRAGHQGLVTHRDDAHVFVAQLGGAKRWSVFDVPADPRLRRIGRVEPGECGQATEVMLSPGDGLYLPPYAPHRACAVPSSDSLHLSIHIREPRARDVVDDAVDRVMTSSMQQAEIAGSAAERAEQIRAILADVGARLTELDPFDLVEAIERRITGR